MESFFLFLGMCVVLNRRASVSSAKPIAFVVLSGSACIHGQANNVHNADCHKTVMKHTPDFTSQGASPEVNRCIRNALLVKAVHLGIRQADSQRLVLPL